MNTRLTQEYEIRLPFVGADSESIAMPSLAAALSNAGGIGILGNAGESALTTQALIQQVKRATSKLFGVDLRVDDSPRGPVTVDAHIGVCIAEHVKLVVFNSQVPPRVWVDRLHAAGARVWMCATSVEHAVGAVAVGVDAIVARDPEPHLLDPSALPPHRLLREVLRAVRPVMVLAALPMASGEDVYRALLAGAEGVWVDTSDSMKGAGGERVHPSGEAPRCGVRRQLPGWEDTIAFRRLPRVTLRPPRVVGLEREPSPSRKSWRP